MLTPRGEFVVKLSRERVDALVAQGKGEYFDPGHGRPMREWFVAKAASARWLDLAREAHTSASSRPTRASRPAPRPKAAERSAPARSTTKPGARGG